MIRGHVCERPPCDEEKNEKDKKKKETRPTEAARVNDILLSVAG